MSRQQSFLQTQIPSRYRTTRDLLYLIQKDIHQLYIKCLRLLNVKALRQSATFGNSVVYSFEYAGKPLNSDAETER